MKDYPQTWWRKIENEIIGAGFHFRWDGLNGYSTAELYENDEDYATHINKIGSDEWDYACEQFWAIQHGLA